MKQVVILEAQRESYTVAQCKSVTVRELIEALEQFDQDLEIFLSHDNGYTYGGIHTEDIDLKSFDEEEL